MFGQYQKEEKKSFVALLLIRCVQKFSLHFVKFSSKIFKNKNPPLKYET